MFARGLVTLLLTCSSLTLAAQPAAPGPLPLERTTAPISLDGSLADAAWSEAAVIDQFYETSPGDNIPAKVKTVAYVTYDDRYFYIGIRADDPEPHRIRAPFVDRDGVIGTDDNIAIFLDTRNDKQSAIELRVNPRGIQADGIFNDANQSEDFSPDFYYDTAATITARGWEAEFRIPFSSLRYGSADPQTWNILVWRNYPRDFRYAFHSAPLPRGANCIICYTHPLTGLTGLPSASHFVAAPYVTAQRQEVARFDEVTGRPGPLEGGDLNTDVGGDLKWTPTANDAIDLTINPDFSQIEADVPQIAVNTRFALFYPEKRPFFLEGFDLFDTPTQVAYTRTIVSPRAGARITGKRGDTAYTLLVAEDRGGGDTIFPESASSDSAPQVFKSYAAIGRVRHDLGTSFIGAVLTAREIDGGGHNRVFGPDVRWRPNESDSVNAQFLVSDTTNPNLPLVDPKWNGESSRSHLFTGEYQRQTRRYDLVVGGSDVGTGFRADLGFITQAGYRQVLAGGGLSFYPEGRIRYFRPSIVVDHQTNRENEKTFGLVSVGVNGFGVKNTQFSALLRREEILVVNQLLEQTYGTLFVQFDPSRRIPRVTLDARFGQQIHFAGREVGTGASVALSSTMRPHDRLDLQLLWNREWLNLDAGRLYTADVQRLRAQYSFSAKSLVRGIVQYVDTEFGNDLHSGGFLGSVLYSYKLNWQTVLFAGYGDERTLLEENRLAPTGRSLFFKVSYAFLR